MTVPKMEVVCNVCGEKVETHATGDYKGLKVEIDPCQNCLKKADAHGHSRGLDEGYRLAVHDQIEGQYS